MEYHPISNIFPMMAKDELLGLCTDMRENGYDQTAPIILLDGKILDGRNRQLAADTIGITPAYQDYNGDETTALAFIISHNLHRRHLNESQRAVIAGRLANMPKYLHKTDRPIGLSQTESAEMLNVSPRTIRRVKAIERESPEFISLIANGTMTAHEAIKKVKEIQRNTARAEIAATGAMVAPSDRWHIYQGDVATWQAPRQYDFIITDPPYPKEYLPLWETLAKRSNEWLKPGGLLIAMSGQSYLDEIYLIMGKYLNYYWTAAYLTPGQPTPMRQVNINTTWKPLLIYSNGRYTGKIIGDVFKSEGNDKNYHNWGQSEGGMLSIINGISLPGQYILDPFCGAGTTGVAALKHGCLFDGLESNNENVNISRSRMAR